MKTQKLLVILIAALFISSCKKSYTCDCTTNTVVTINFPGFPSAPFTIPSQTTSKAYNEKMTETQATSACNHEKETLESTEKAAFDDNFKLYASYFQYTYSTRCSLK